MLEISILINKQINQMTNKIMSFNEFIAEVAGRKLIEYRYGILEEEIGEELLVMQDSGGKTIGIERMNFVLADQNFLDVQLQYL